MTTLPAAQSNSQPYADESAQFNEELQHRKNEAQALINLLDAELDTYASQIELAVIEYNQRLRRRNGLQNTIDRVTAALAVPMITMEADPVGVLTSEAIMSALGHDDGAKDVAAHLQDNRERHERSRREAGAVR
jgi:hypothetical protein